MKPIFRSRPDVWASSSLGFVNISSSPIVIQSERRGGRSDSRFQIPDSWASSLRSRIVGNVNVQWRWDSSFLRLPWRCRSPRLLLYIPFSSLFIIFFFLSHLCALDISLEVFVVERPDKVNRSAYSSSFSPWILIWLSYIQWLSVSFSDSGLGIGSDSCDLICLVL